ncbi:MAG TPA: PHP domain-containing protein [Candidatus Dormibacteraeota bacterium]
MGRADPHCHTTASDGMVEPAELVAAARALDLDLIAVTDHDTMASVAETVALGEAAGLAVVPGQEITTAWPAQTHLVGWFLEKPVRSGMSLADSVAAVHDQGGLAMVPHPFMPTFFASCQEGMLARLIETQIIDAVELEYTAPNTAARRAALRRFYDRHRERLGAAVGGSDSHFGRHDLGRILTEFDGTSAAAFRAALEARTTRPLAGRRARVPVRLIARQQARSLVGLPLRRLRGQLQQR